MFTEFGKTSIRIKQNPIIFVQHLSFLSDKKFQTVGQLSSNYSGDFAKTAPLSYSEPGVYRGIHYFLIFLKNIDRGYSLEMTQCFEQK